MRTKLLIIGYLLLAIWLTGCTITKRVHRGGYHVEWHKRYKTEASGNEEVNKTESEKQENTKESTTLKLEEMDQFDTLSICAEKRDVNSAKENHFKKETTKSKIAVSSDRVVSQEKVIRSLQKKMRDENKKEEEPNRDEKIVIGANIAYVLFILIALLFIITAKYLLEFWVVILCILLFLLIIMTVVTLFVVKDDRNLRGKYKKQYRRIKTTVAIAWGIALGAPLILLGGVLAIFLLYELIVWIIAISPSVEIAILLIMLLIGLFVGIGALIYDAL